MELVRFNAALGLYRGQIDNATYWRYTNGHLPKVLKWLVERPEVAQALAEDAIELAAQRATADDTTASRMAS